MGNRTRLARVCGVFEVTDLRVPGTRFRVKVIERGDSGEFLAFPNVCWKSDGQPDWISGFGSTEEEALRDLLGWFLSELDRLGELRETDVEWADPRDF